MRTGRTLLRLFLLLAMVVVGAGFARHENVLRPDLTTATPPASASASSSPHTASLDASVAGRAPTTAPPQTAPPTTAAAPASTVPPTTAPPATAPPATAPPTTAAHSVKASTAAAPAAPSRSSGAYGCAAALAWLGSHSAPGFSFECPGYALGHQAMTCINIPGVCAGSRLIVISIPCAAAYMNEAHNSWVLAGYTTGSIDPYGYCG